MIYACVRPVVIASVIIVLTWLRLKEGRRKEQSQKIDDLHTLVTCQSGTSAMLSSSLKVNSPVAIINEVRCYEKKIEESEKGRQPPRVEPRTPLA